MLKSIMRVFLATAISKKNEYGYHYVKEIERILVSLKHEVILCIYNIDNDEQNSESTASDILNDIKESDVFIGEMNMPSQTLGFLIAYALQIGKLCLYVYPEDSKGKPKPPLLGNPSRLLSIRSFNKDNFNTILIEYMNKAQEKLKSTRITFTTSKEIKRYIDNKSKQTGLSKGEVLRGLIEKSIKNINLQED